MGAKLCRFIDIGQARPRPDPPACSLITDRCVLSEVLMAAFVLRRIGQTIIVLLIASVIIFALMRMIPGDPVQIIMGSEYSREAEAQLRQELGLDRSIMAQYVIWIGNVVRGEFGYSYLNHERVGVLLWDAFLPTLFLVIGTTIVGLLIALPSGIIAAIKKDSVWDYGSMGFAIVGYSMPSFWKGILLIWIFGVYLRWFPTMGYVH